jgi:DinB family protein
MPKKLKKNVVSKRSRTSQSRSKAPRQKSKASAGRSKTTRAPRTATERREDRALREHLLYLLRGGGAHLDLEKAIAGLPPGLWGRKPPGLPFTAWRLIEHMRIAQWDILEFSRNPRHVSPQWPNGYWPQTDEPPNAAAWENCVKSFRADLNALEKLVSDSAKNLFAPFAHGEGQTLLREALLVADHNAYHLGQLVLLRRLLGAWPPET